MKGYGNLQSHLKNLHSPATSTGAALTRQCRFNSAVDDAADFAGLVHFYIFNQTINNF